MKITAIILLSACLVASATGDAQSITLSEKNAPLEKVFNEIAKQSGYEFLYTTKMLKDAKKVDINVKAASLQEVLNLCFKDQPFSYTIIEKTVVVKPKKEELNVLTENETPPLPPIDIKGRITNEDGEPVIASILVKGTQQGTTSNAEGYFELKGVDENATLLITGVSIEKLEIKVAGKNNFDLTAKTKVTSLNEVVIGKGYYEEKQKFTVGNAVRITAKDIEKQPVQNPLLALQGRVPGLEVTQLTGVNGGAIKIRIQGQNSIQSGNDPLIVVDGIPYSSQMVNTGSFEQVVGSGSPLTYINPLDIETIDVLKDADATAIYGSRAANGAIVITTKQGKPGKAKVDLRIQQGWGDVEGKIDMLNTRQYLDMRYEAYKNDGIDWKASNVSANDLKLWDTTRYTDWQKDLIGGTARYTNASASVSGGTSAVQYMVGLTYGRTTTVFPGDFDDSRGAFHLNLQTASANQRFRMNLSTNYLIDDNHLPSTDLTDKAVKLEPNAPAVISANGTVNWAVNAAGNATWENPIIYQFYNDFSHLAKNLVSNASVSYLVLPELEIKTTLGFNILQTKRYALHPLAAEPPARQLSSNRSANFMSTSSNSWIVEPQISYNKMLGKGKLNALIGTSFQQNGNEYFQVQGSGYSSDQLLKNLSAASSVFVYTDQKEYKYNAIFGRLGYVWDDKYIMNLTARRDGSSRFGDNNKFNNFGSIGLGWIFTKEKAIESGLPFLSFGKLRTSYGITGNDNIPDYGYLGLYDNTGSDMILYQGQVGLASSGLSNPYLQWEEVKKIQFGFDLGFLNNRILFNATFARNRSSNQLMNYLLAATTGFNGITNNFPATVQNSSLEFSINTENVKKENFVWNSSANLTIPRNKLIDFPNIEQSFYGGRLIVGQPLDGIKVVKFTGVDPATGYNTFADYNGNPTTDVPPGSAYIFISGFSKYYGGIQNSISYKGFQLEFLFQFVRKLGQRFYYNGARSPGRFASGSSNQPVSILDHWQHPGDIAKYARVSSNLVIGLGQSDAGYSFDASFTRLKNLSLRWQLPSKMVTGLKLRNAQIFVQAQNLLTITKYDGLDPETASINSLPPLRIITTGVNLGF